MTDNERCESLGSSATITITIPAYNALLTVGRTLDSVLAQTCAEWEVSVVDDGSTDGTAALLDAYAERDSRIRVSHQSNAGTGAALNAAVSHARGEFIVQMGADDEFLPDYVETMLACVKGNPGCDVYSCNAWLQHSDGTRLLYARGPGAEQPQTMSLDDFLRGEPYLFAGGALVRRSLWNELGGFRPGYYCEDVDFWGRALAHGARHLYCPEPLVIYNVGNPGQKTTDISAKCNGTIEVYESLIESGLLDERSIELARAAVVRVTQVREMETGSRRFRQRVERFFGTGKADAVVGFAHRFTWMVRPLRQWAAKRKVR